MFPFIIILHIINIQRICSFVFCFVFYANIEMMLFVHQAESGQGDLGTLANVVTSLANLNDSLSNGETTDDQMEESPSEITRCVNNADNTLWYYY